MAVECVSRVIERGFTLLELLVVIVIIGLLAAYVGPKYFSQIQRSEIAVAKAQIEAFDKALDTYRIDMGRYPGSEQGLEALIRRSDNNAKWRGPYLKSEIPLDPWGNPYRYQQPGPNGLEYQVMSFGKDGNPGGSGDDADLSNR